MVSLLPFVDPEGMECRATIMVPGAPENLECAVVERLLAHVGFCEKDVSVPNQECSGFGIEAVNDPNDHDMRPLIELLHMADRSCRFERRQQQCEPDV